MCNIGNKIGEKEENIGDKDWRERSVIMEIKMCNIGEKDM